MSLRLGLVVTALLVCTSAAWAEGVAPISSATPAPLTTRAQIAKSLRPSLVLVEYAVQRANGQMPWFSGHVDEALVVLKAPVTKTGILVGKDTVVSNDIGLDARFVKTIQVRRGRDLAPVPAEIVAFGDRASVVHLRLKRPLPGARPLPKARWRADGKAAYAVTLSEHRGAYATSVRSAVARAFVFPDRGEAKIQSSRGGLLVTAQGDPISLGHAFDVGVKGHPSTWASLTRSSLAARTRALAERVGHEVVRVHLTFRSPLRKPKYQEFKMEWNGLGLLVPSGRVLVFADLKAKTTARLKTIQVIGSTTTNATFEVSLKRHGAFVAKLTQPMGKPATLDAEPTSLNGSLVLAAGVRVAGEKRTNRFGRHHLNMRFVRLGSVRFEYAGDLGSFFGYSNNNSRSGTFLYSRTGKLLGVPLSFREGTPYQRFSSGGTLSVALLRSVLADLKGEQVDLANRPLSKEASQRLAWLGVELQPLTPELAREAKVLGRTNGGYTGGLVVHVYPNSPASKAKLEEGDVVTAVRSDERPELSVQLNRYAYSQHTRFPWKELDRCSDAYFEHLPKPWPPVETLITRALTDLGFGKTFTVEISREGKILQLPMVVTAGPKSFDSAKRATDKSLGVTVANMTYEVRRVLRRKANTPGVVVAKIERGSKMSIAGLKPYEVVTHVNNEPIMTVADFTKAVAKGGTLRFSTKRLHMGRIVKVTLPVTKSLAKKAATTDTKPKPTKAKGSTKAKSSTEKPEPVYSSDIPDKTEKKTTPKTVATSPH